MYKFTCEKCGGEFYSKADPSGWRHKMCNACSGKPYKDYPVETTTLTAPKPVPTKPVYNNIAPTKPKQEFNLDDYIMDMLSVFETLKVSCDEAKLTIPIDNLCQWTTSIMIQKGKLNS
jgi:hypothetical protein